MCNGQYGSLQSDARIVDLDAGVTNRANGDGEGDALQQWEVDMGGT
jgi:hypothetical protein